MNDESRIVLLRLYGLLNLIERHFNELNIRTFFFRKIQFQCQECGGQFPWDGNAERCAFIVVVPGAVFDENRTVFIPHAGTAVAEGIHIVEIGVGVNAYSGQFEFAVKCPAVERFNIDEFMDKLILPGIKFPFGKGVKHEGIVGIGAVSHSDNLLRHGKQAMNNKDSSIVASELRRCNHVQTKSRLAVIPDFTTARLNDNGQCYKMRCMSRKKIKVLQVLVCLGGGGVETLLLDLQKRLPEHITFDYLVAHSDFRDKEAQTFASTIHVTPPEMQPPTRWATLVGQLVREYHYDAVHFHRFAFSGSVMKAAKQAGAAGRIAHSHRTNLQDASLLMRSFYKPYHWTINRWLLFRHATNIVGCSSEALRHLIGPFKKSPQCRVILNGILMDVYAEKMGSIPKKELCQRYGVSVDAPVIGNFARLTPVKNHEFLLRVFDLLVKRNRNHLAGTPALGKSILFIGGEGPMRSQLEQDRDQYALQDRIFLPGHCADVPEMLSGLFDCFVIPSKMEGLPISMIEAVAAGLYVVCTDAITKDVAQAFPDRVTMLPLSASLERWAEAIEYAIQQRIPPEKGLELVRHSPMVFDRFVEEIVKMYESVVS